MISACEGVLAKGSPAPVLRRQLLASLGTFASASEDQKTRDAAYALMRETLATPAEGDEAKLGEDLASSGLAGQEATFLADVLAHQPDLGIASPLSSAIVKTNDSEAIAALDAATIAFALVNDMDGLGAHPHLRRMNVDTPNGPVSLPAPAPIFSGETRAFGPVPALGSAGADAHD